MEVLKAILIVVPHLIEIGLEYLELLDGLLFHLVHMFMKSSHLGCQVGIFLH